MRARAKTAICRILAVLPCWCWPADFVGLIETLPESEATLLRRVTERPTERNTWRAITKRALCSTIAALPCRFWPVASAIVRRLWPGFRDA